MNFHLALSVMPEALSRASIQNFKAFWIPDQHTSGMTAKHIPNHL